MRVSDRSHESGDVHFSAEFGLLLACCADPRANSREKLRFALSRRYDFAAFIRLAIEHRVVPQVYRSLNKQSELLGDTDLAVLRTAYEENARRALCLTGELLRVVRHLEAHGIEVIPYKGPVLAQDLYCDVTARQFFDVDILVSPQDVVPAKAALVKLGYVSEINLSAREEASFIASGYEYAFSGVAGRHALELKWRILPHFYSVAFDTRVFFSRAKKLALQGYTLSTLCESDLLLVLCAHAAKHMWAQLSWLCDIAELMGSPQINWGGFWREAERLGIQRIVGISVLLACDLFGSELPIAVQELCSKDSEIKTLSQHIVRMISEGCSYDSEGPPYFKFMLRLRGRRWDKLRFLWRLVWTPSIGEWAAVELPERLAFGYYLVRVGRLARKLFDARPVSGRAREANG